MVARETSQERIFASMKAELMQSNRVMQEEMFKTIALLEQKCESKERTLTNIEQRHSAFKTEFAQLLDDKDHSDSQYNKVRYELDHIE